VKILLNRAATFSPCSEKTKCRKSLYFHSSAAVRTGGRRIRIPRRTTFALGAGWKSVLRNAWRIDNLNLGLSRRDFRLSRAYGEPANLLAASACMTR
jgi:hypothetical protein